MPSVGRDTRARVGSGATLRDYARHAMTSCSRKNTVGSAVPSFAGGAMAAESRPNGPSVRAMPQACTMPARANGRRVMLGPPARTIALATAGPSGGTPGSPTPVGAAVLGTMNTSTAGIS